MKIIGTYQIINTINQKSYVGSSTDIYKRWNEHKRDLKAQKHHNDHLQAAWNKYGSDAFQFHIIQQVDTAKKSLIDEQLLLNILYDGGKLCYNIAKNATAPMLGKILTPEHKKKISLSRTGNIGGNTGKNPSLETRAKMSVAQTGKIVSLETRTKLSAAKKGKKMSPEVKAKIKAKISTYHKIRREAKALLDSVVTPNNPDL